MSMTPTTEEAKTKGQEPMSTRAQGAVGAGKSFQERVVGNFRHVCNEVGDPTDLAERRDRFGEEAMEIFQSLDGTHEAARQIVDYVFGREKGQPRKEIGQGLVTLAALATHAGHDLMACGEEELARLWQPEVIEKIRRKRAARHGRGPLPGVDAALAAPRADSAERTAGEGSPFGDVLPDPASEIATQVMNLPWTRHSLGTPGQGFDDDGLCDRHGDVQMIARRVIASTPAPSSPGVPDSVRALSEAATQGAWAFDRGLIPPDGPGRYADIYVEGGNDTIISSINEMVEFSPAEGAANGAFIVAAVNYVRTLLSAHPAGPSEGCDWCLSLTGKRDPHRSCANCAPPKSRPAHPAGQSTRQGAEVGGSVDIIERCVKLATDAGIDSVMITGSVRRWQDIIAKLRKPAPDSTRTGQVETVSVPIEPTEEMMAAGAPFTDDFHSVAADAYRAMIAARPAAPEAQGAWRSKAATEIDAIAQQWGTEGDADGRAYAKTLAAILRAENPAPPASSGQGGR